MSKEHDIGNPIGRPRKADGPVVPYDELDRLLVFGEVVECDDGQGTAVVYPAYRDLAQRFGVSHSTISAYSRSRNCMNRREVAQARVIAQSDQKLIELRANALARSKKDDLRTIDTYLAEFEKALAEGRVRCDSASDFNTMIRLKEFIQGGADSRSELHIGLSLDDLQARHRRMMKSLDGGEHPSDDQNERTSRPACPSCSREFDAEELLVQSPDRLIDKPVDSSSTGVSAAPSAGVRDDLWKDTVYIYDSGSFEVPYQGEAAEPCKHTAVDNGGNGDLEPSPAERLIEAPAAGSFNDRSGESDDT